MGPQLICQSSGSPTVAADFYAQHLQPRKPEFPSPVLARRTFNTQAIAAAAALCGTWPHALASPPHPQAKWHTAALNMLRQAQSWGDQPYGAVLVLGDAVVGEGPSRVVKDNNPDAHAERVALLDAQRRLGRADLAGAVLYSTSRPCPLCEAAAQRAGVRRMYFGPQLTGRTLP